MIPLTHENARKGIRVTLIQDKIRHIKIDRWVKNKFNLVATITRKRDNIVTLLWDGETESHDYSIDFLQLMPLSEILNNISYYIRKMDETD